MKQRILAHFVLRRIVKLALFSLLFFGAGFAYKYYLPRLEAWLLFKVKEQSQANMPVNIVPENLSFHLIPLGATLENVKVFPKKELQKYMAPTQVGLIGANLNILSLLRGQLRLSKVYFENAELSLFFDENLFKANPQTGKKFDFDVIYRLPVDQVILERVVIQGKILPQNIVFRSESIDLSIENRYRSLLIELNVPKIMLKPSGPTRPISVQLQARTLLESKEAQISAFKLKADESYIVASGRLSGDLANGEVDDSLFNTRAHISLPDIAYWLETIPQLKSAPKLVGSLDVEVSVDAQAKKKSPQLNFQMTGLDLQIGKYLVGEVKVKGEGSINSFTVSDLTVKNNSGSASLTNAIIERLPHWKIKSNVVAEKVQLHQVLKNLGVKAPVHAEIGGNFQCQGAWTEKPQLNCQGEGRGNKLLVTSGERGRKIVEADKISAEGGLTVTPSEVHFKTALKMGAKSKGRGDGIVNYKTGFKINFESELLDTTEVKNLSNLKMEGLLNLKGHTEGTSDWGTTTITAQGTDLWLEDYPLGNLMTEIHYKAGQLSFNKSQGQYGVSRFNGSVVLDLPKEQIAIDGQMAFVDLRDIFAMFQRKTAFPFIINGTGSGTVKAHGPLNFRKLSYTLQSSFFRGSAFEENFDKIVFNVSADKGLVKSDTIRLTKAGGTVDMEGTITPDAVINAKITGRKLRLEQSENVMNLGLDLQGQADFTLLLKGDLPKPTWDMEGKVSQMILAERPTDDSKFKFTAHNDHIEGSGAFMGSVIETQFNIPFQSNLPFSLKLKTKKLDFTNVFSLLSRSARQLDFSTSLTMDANLNSAAGGFWNSTGEARVSEFVIRKGPSSMQAEKPMRLTFNNGQITSKDFEITSGDSYLRFEARNMTKSNLDSSLNGKMDLSLLGLLTPFISDLRGNLSISMDLKGNIEHPNMSGSAYVDKAYVKLRDFPHPFSAVRADVLFNQTQVLINALRADFAGGKASGEGRLEFFGAENNPIDIRGIFNDVNLNFPEGFHTKGSGQVAIRGSQFPYLMQIQYDVSGGEVSAELQGGGASTTVKASNYLPKFITNESFQPFSYFVDVNLRKPVLVNNSLVQALVQGSVKAAGTPDRLILNGTLTPLPGGKLFFRDTAFDIINGYVEFVNSSYDTPKIYLTASSTVTQTVSIDDTHQHETQFDISMLVQGKGPNPQITLSSQPPLSQKEIISLLALGLTPEALDQSRKSNTGTTTTTAVANALLQRDASRKLKNATGFEVKLSSSQATQENASSPKITFTKQWTPKFGASASGTLKSNPTSDVKLEYKVNKGTSVIGSWEGKEQGASSETKDASKSVFGLDLEYKVNFK